VFVGLALAWAIVELFTSRGRRRWLHVGLVLATFALGLITALQLAKDAWAAMPGALLLSVITLILAVALNWAAYSARGRGEATWEACTSPPRWQPPCCSAPAAAVRAIPWNTALRRSFHSPIAASCQQ